MENIQTNSLGSEGRILITAKMPLAELISDFDDRLKSVSEGFASFNYELSGYQKRGIGKNGNFGCRRAGGRTYPRYTEEKT